MNENVTKVVCFLFVLVSSIAFIFIAPIFAIKIYALTFGAFFGLPTPGYWMMMALLSAKSYLLGNTAILLRLDDIVEKEGDKFSLAVKKVIRYYVALFSAYGFVWLCVG